MHLWKQKFVIESKKESNYILCISEYKIKYKWKLMYFINLYTCLRDMDLQSDVSFVLLREKHTAISANPVKIFNPDINDRATH